MQKRMLSWSHYCWGGGLCNKWHRHGVPRRRKHFLSSQVDGAREIACKQWMRSSEFAPSFFSRSQVRSGCGFSQRGVHAITRRKRRRKKRKGILAKGRRIDRMWLRSKMKWRFKKRVRKSEVKLHFLQFFVANFWASLLIQPRMLAPLFPSLSPFSLLTSPRDN